MPAFQFSHPKADGQRAPIEVCRPISKWWYDDEKTVLQSLGGVWFGSQGGIRAWLTLCLAPPPPLPPHLYSFPFIKDNLSELKKEANFFISWPYVSLKRNKLSQFRWWQNGFLTLFWLLSDWPPTRIPTSLICFLKKNLFAARSLSFWPALTTWPLPLCLVK